MDSAERSRPVEKLDVAIGVRSEVELAETAAQAVDGNGDMFVLVGVDTDDDGLTP
jgi:hypothetical protein